MKQGRASRDVMESTKVEPRSRAVNPGAAGQIGVALGNHVTDKRTSSTYKGEELYPGKGFQAPGVKSQSRNRGSQGRY